MTAPATDRLEELRSAAHRASLRVRQLEAAARSSGRALAAALEPLRAYEEAVGAGERDPDEDEERRLLDAVRQAEGAVTMRPVRSDGRVVSLEPVDERAEARLRGARRALEAAEADVSSFAAGALDRLVEERLEQSRAVGREYVEAAARLRAADDAWGAERAYFATIARLAGREGELPTAPRPLTLVPGEFIELERRAQVGGVGPAPVERVEPVR